MKRLTEKQSRHSLTTQIVLWVVGFVSVLFVSALFIMFHHARQSIYQEAMEKARQTLRTTELRIDNTLSEVETATRSMQWTIEKRIGQPEIMDSLCRQLVSVNPHILGCAIAFEPGVYPEYGTYYGVYAYRSHSDSTKIRTTIICGRQPYTREKWYFIPLHNEAPIWIDPYFDREQGETSLVTSYGMPLRNKDGELVGVLSAHISMKWFADLILSLRPFPNSHATVMSTDGHLIIHPENTLKEHEAHFNEAYSDVTSDAHLAAISMMTGHAGHSEMRIDGKQNFIFYHPFENAGWSVAIVCPESDIFNSYYSLQRYTIIISLTGLVLLALFCLFISHRQLRPLQRLVDKARGMAEGQLDVPVEMSHRTDEVGYVQNTFRQMQERIRQHIADITHLTDVLRQRNEDLKLAYEQAREADRMKDAVILNMSDRMEQSVKGIHATVGEFRQHVANMDAEECCHMAEKIGRYTETTTDLLGNLLDIADRKKTKEEGRPC
ncbi:MAG: HAMP domain-containing protein [Prevotella sp.]|nr:HAMP domain-containing protein [Prevotella sp.]